MGGIVDVAPPPVLASHVVRSQVHFSDLAKRLKYTECVCVCEQERTCECVLV